MIKNNQELLDEIGVDTVAQAEKAIYKGTDCGAWIQCEEDGVTVGSIVEGSDAEVTRDKLEYPIEVKEFWDCVEDVNSEACELWEEANYEYNLEEEEKLVHSGEIDAVDEFLG
jgi:hypothetical protein